MTESKKAWVTPELIVLVRSKPEEAVLVVCKGWPSTGQNNIHWACAIDCAPTGCLSIGAS
jgi:hypothetical protein